MWEEVRRLRDGGTTVFMTTHYLEEADALCDRLAIIDHGKIVAEGTSEDLKRQIAGDLVIVGINGEPQVAHALLVQEPFVREASCEDGRLRLLWTTSSCGKPAARSATRPREECHEVSA